MIGLFVSFLTYAQIDHWESVVLPGDQWQYLLPSSQPNSNWNQVEFNSSSWDSGNSGFGYGDADDTTVLPSTISVYIRSTFTITDASVIEAMVLDLDYADGFVASLNGQEIARNLVSGSVPNFDQASDGNHEAMLYQGFAPERFTVDTALLTTGTNVIAVQVHNESINSSDLTVLPILSVGVNTTDYDYRTPPSWFETPNIPSEVNFESSNLPIVVIDTEQGQQIPDDPKINATMKIIYNANGQRNFLTDINNASALHYDGAIKIEYRGSSSSLLEKKQYAFTPYDDQGEKVNVSFLEMPKEN